MILFFSVVLGLAWIAVLVPAALKARREAPLSAAQRFKHRMDLIAPSARRSGRWVCVPRVGPERPGVRSHRRAQEQRKRLLEVLLGIAGATFLLALLAGGAWTRLHVIADIVLVSYAVLLVGAKRKRADTRMKIRPLVQRREERGRDFDDTFTPLKAYGGSRR